eukprot:jgi/Psemu1/311132/fgenesh1_kg.726_\
MTMKHFGKQLTTTSTADSNICYHTAPPSPARSTFSTKEHAKTFNQEASSEQLLPFQNQDYNHNHYPVRHRISVSPNNRFSEGDPPSTSSPTSGFSSMRQQHHHHQQQQHQQQHPLHVVNHRPTENEMLVGSTIFTVSSIGLPSKYPGSSGHDREHSLESIVMEELQDFDEIFGQGASASARSDKCPTSPNRNRTRSRNSHAINHDCGDDHATTESPPPRIQNEDVNYDDGDDDDDDDDLYALSRSPMQARDSQSRKSFLYTSRNSGSASSDEYDDDDSTREFLARIQNTYQNCDDDDDDDDLCILSRSQALHVPRTSTRPVPVESFHHNHSRNPSELSCTSTSLSLSASTLYPPEEILVENPTRTESVTTSSDDETKEGHHHRRSSSSGVPPSSFKGHRRSRNRALGSSEFFDSILKQL